MKSFLDKLITEWNMKISIVQHDDDTITGDHVDMITCEHTSITWSRWTQGMDYFLAMQNNTPCVYLFQEVTDNWQSL